MGIPNIEVDILNIKVIRNIKYILLSNLINTIYGMAGNKTGKNLTFQIKNI